MAGVGINYREPFLQRAAELNMAPDSMAKTLLDHADKLPEEFWTVAKNSSLDNALDDLTRNLDMTYVIKELVKRVVGDRACRVESYHSDLENDAFSLVLDMCGDETDCVVLQFGHGARERIIVYMKDVTDLDDETRAKIRRMLDGDTEFCEDWDLGYLKFCLDTPSYGFDPPKLDDMPVAEIKNLIRSNRKKQRPDR